MQGEEMMWPLKLEKKFQQLLWSTVLCLQDTGKKIDT